MNAKQLFSEMEVKVSKYIPQEHLVEIMKHLPRKDQIITEVLFHTGFRLDDVMYMRRWQLDRKYAKAVEAKTGKRRAVEIPRKLQEVLHDYFINQNIRSQFAYCWKAYLRKGNSRKKQHRTTYWRHFDRAVRAAGFAGRDYSPHSLRKCYAVNLYRQTGSLVTVQKDMNHSSLATTMLYALSDKL